ncbi:MAG: hypothetical protein MJ239_01075 [Bacilli bacterium]|nr:hypothetical protein [Bacilli bacterium]
MKVKMSVVQKMTLAAMLIVICILGTRLPGYAQVGGPFSFNRITFGPAVVIFSSLVLGPFYGFVVGAGSDALGWVLMGTHTGAINIFVTMLYGLLGIAPYFLVKITRPFRFKKGTPWTLYAVIFSLWVLLLIFLLATNWFDTSFVKWGFDPTICKFVAAGLSFVLMVAFLIGLHFSNKYFQKRSLDLGILPSPYEIAFICTLCEIVFMILLKPLGFYGYCWIFLGGTIESQWGVSYSLLVLLSILFSFAEIFVNSFFVSWLLMLSKSYVHYYGEEIKQDLKDLKKAVEGEDVDEDAEIDVSQLSEEEKAQLKQKFPVGWIIFFVTVVALMVIAIILIAVNGWPSSSSSTSTSIASLLESLHS